MAKFLFDTIFWLKDEKKALLVVHWPGCFHSKEYFRFVHKDTSDSFFYFKWPESMATKWRKGSWKKKFFRGIFCIFIKAFDCTYFIDKFWNICQSRLIWLKMQSLELISPQKLGNFLRKMKCPKSQCGNFIDFPSLRIYVKSKLASLESQNLPFSHI